MATYHVGPTGNDTTGTGADGNRWLTIGKALQMVAPGDTVMLHAAAGPLPHTYYESVDVLTSGTAANQITFEGEMSGSTRLVSVDASTAVTGTWTPAGEAQLLGTGVWSIAGIPDTPGILLEDSTFNMISKIDTAYMDGNPTNDGFNMTGFDILSQPSNSTYPNYFAIQVWDGIEAQWGKRSSGLTYIRYRNGDDPNTKNLRYGVGPATLYGVLEGHVIRCNGRSYNTFRNLILQGAQSGILFQGDDVAGEATRNIAENCLVRCCTYRAAFRGRANGNIVRDSVLKSGLIGLTTFPVTDTLDGYLRNVAFRQYWVDKFHFGKSVERDAGMKVMDTVEYKPTANKLHDCEITEGSQGANWGGDGGGDGTLFHDNDVHHNFTQGIYIDGGQAKNCRVYFNKFRNNGMYNMFRTNRLDLDYGTWYIFGNMSSQLGGRSTHVALYQANGGEGSNMNWNAWWYHNSFSGGNVCFEMYGLDPGFSAPNFRMVNSYISMDIGCTIFASPSFDFENAAARIPAWDYNAHRMSFSYLSPPAWVDEHSIILTSNAWSTAQVESIFALPVGNPGLNAGINIAAPFTIRGQNYPALPGYLNPYFTGGAPHIGAWQQPLPITPEASTMLSPAPGSVFAGATITFTWTAGSGPTEWGLDVGTTFAATDIYWANVYTTSHEVTVLPVDGSTVFVRLWSLIDGVWVSNDYQYQAFGGTEPSGGQIAPGPPSGTNVRLILVNR